MKPCVVLLLASLLLCLSDSSLGQIPRTISYQGVLCDLSGTPKKNGSYTFTFRLYDAGSGGTELWKEQKTLTTTQGLFFTQLGDLVVFGSNLTFDKPYWLGIQVANETEMTPRILLTSAGYSFTAVGADTAKYALNVKDGAITGAKVASGQVVKSINALNDDITLQAGSNVSIGRSGNTLTISATGGGSVGDDLGNHTATQNIDLNGHWLSGDGGDKGIFVNSSGDVGIGTSSLSANLHVGGLNGVVFEGTPLSGTIPKEGSGTRMMWYPRKSAFRVGSVAGNEWDDGNIGSHSTAMGDGTTASGVYSTATGSDTKAIGNYSTAIGNGTTASGRISTAIGNGTTASGLLSTAMGDGTTASGTASTAMGELTTASGAYSTAMGSSATASGWYSTAIGSNVSTNGKDGAFIIGDNSTTQMVQNNHPNEFVAVFGGGYTLWSTRAMNQGVYMVANTSGWANVCDRNKKENFRAIDGEELLSKVRAMSVTEWNYRGADPSIKYIGPVAQEFHAAFHLNGSDSLGINSISIDGVNMAAVQALERRTAELREKTAELEVVKSELADMKARLARVEEALAVPKDLTQRVYDENQR